MIIAVDIDEVLSCFVERLVEYFNANADSFPFRSTSQVATDTFSSYRFCEVWGGTDEDSLVVVEGFFKSHFFADLPLVDGCIKGLQVLKEAGHDLHVVTSRQLFLEAQTRKWLALHFGDGFFNTIHFGNHWGKEGKKVSKPDLCKQIGAGVIIDDSVGYCWDCADDGITALLFGDYAWNSTEGEKLPTAVVRCTDWPAVCTQIAELAGDPGKDGGQ